MYVVELCMVSVGDVCGSAGHNYVSEMRDACVTRPRFCCQRKFWQKLRAIIRSTSAHTITKTKEKI